MPDPATPTIAPVGFDPTGKQYASYEEFANAWKNTKSYLKLPVEQRVDSFNEIRSRWQTTQDEKAAAAANAPDLMGRVQEKVAGAGEYLGKNIAETAGAGPEGQAIAGKIGKWGGELITPPNNAQAMIDAVLFASGTKEADWAAQILKEASPATKMLARVLTPTVAGTVGGATSGHPVSGAISGATQGLGIEVLSGVTGIARRAIQKSDIKAIGDWLADTLGKGSKIGEAHEFSTLPKINNELVGGETEARIGQKMTKVNNKISVSIQDKLPVKISDDLAAALKIKKPVGGDYWQDFSFKDATDKLEQLENIGWDPQMRIKRGLTAQKARSAAHQMEGDIAESLAKVNPKLAQEWYTLRGQYRGAKTLSSLFREKGVIENGQLNMSKLQQLLNDAGPNGYKMDLQQSLGYKGNLPGVARRGGTPGMVDIPGQRPRLGVSYHIGLPHPWMTGVGRFPRHVGYVPFDLGRGRALVGVTILGAHQFTNSLDQLPDDPTRDVMSAQ